jgi:ABC-2 type transport system ATP-binding protein
VVTANNQLAIDLHSVKKVYRGRIHALRGIEMQVHRGEIFGLLGPNGAGKSTLVKIMMTVVRPTYATGSMLGERLGTKRMLRHVGYLPEHHRFPRYLTGRQVLEYYAALAHVPRRERQVRSMELLDVVGMKDWADGKIGSYSKGMMQRVGLAQAMMNEPHLIVLDEPTDGVDPVGRRDIRDVLLRLRETGTTVFLNSHLLSELEMVCDRVAIMVQGQVAMQGTIDELTADSRRYEIVIEGGAPSWLNEFDASQVVDLPGDRSQLVLRGSETPPVQTLIDRLRSEQRTIISVRPVRETLEDLFMRAITDPTTGQIHKPGAAPQARRTPPTQPQGGAA